MPIDPTDYFSGNYVEQNVNFEDIDEVPITFMFMGDDSRCPVEDNERIVQETFSEIFEYTQEYADHHYPTWIQGDDWLSKIVNAIEVGYVDYIEPEYQTSVYTDGENQFWAPFADQQTNLLENALTQ